MLNAMRDGAHSKIVSTILFGLLLLAAGGMAFMDVGGFFRNGTGTNSVAKVGSEEISSQAFDNTVQRVVRKQGMTAKQAYQYGMIDQILMQDVNSRLLSQGAMKNGIYVGDNEVAAQITQLVAPALKGQPGITPKDALHRMLQGQGMTEQELVGTIRNSMMSTVLQATLQTGTTTPPRQEVLDLYRVQNETRVVEGFMLPNDTVKGVDEAKDDVLKAFYEAAKGAKYAVPESRTFTMAVLGEDNVKSSLTISDDDLKKEYDKSISTFTSTEQRVVQQAVFDKEDVAKKAIDAVKGGKSLKDAAKEATGKDTAYMGEETYVKAGLAKPVSDAAFSAKEGDTAGPIKTALGYHVLVVKKIMASKPKSFESVKDEIRKEQMESKLSQQMLNTANSIDDRLAGGEDINKIAKELNMKVETLGPMEKSGATADKHDALKDYPPKDRSYILKTAFEMNENESAPVMQLSDGRYAAIHMDKIKPLSFRPFEEVRDDIKKSWLNDQRGSLNHDRAIHVQQAVAGGQQTLAAAAAANGASVTTFSGLKRTGDAPAAIGKEGMDTIFDAAKGETVMAQVPNGYLIGTLKSIDAPDASKVSDKDLKPLIDTLKKNAGDEVMMAYIKYLQEKLGVTVNRNLLNMMYGAEANADNNPS